MDNIIQFKVSKHEMNKEVKNLIWTAKAIGNKEGQYNFDCVFVDENGFVHASDGLRYQNARIYDLIEPGYYNVVKLTKTLIQLSKNNDCLYLYPSEEILKILVNFDGKISGEFELKEEMGNTSDKSHFLSIVFYFISKFYDQPFNYNFIFDIFDDLEDNWVFYKFGDGGTAIFISLGLERNVVVMPLKIRWENK